MFKKEIINAAGIKVQSTILHLKEKPCLGAITLLPIVIELGIGEFRTTIHNCH